MEKEYKTKLINESPAYIAMELTDVEGEEEPFTYIYLRSYKRKDLEEALINERNIIGNRKKLNYKPKLNRQTSKGTS